jgi:hypothetical protein
LGRVSQGHSSLMAFTIICSSTVAAICCCILARSISPSAQFTRRLIGSLNRTTEATGRVTPIRGDARRGRVFPDVCYIKERKLVAVVRVQCAVRRLPRTLDQIAMILSDPKLLCSQHTHSLNLHCRACPIDPHFHYPAGQILDCNADPWFTSKTFFFLFARQQAGAI